MRDNSTENNIKMISKTSEWEKAQSLRDCDCVQLLQGILQISFHYEYHEKSE